VLNYLQYTGNQQTVADLAARDEQVERLTDETSSLNREINDINAANNRELSRLNGQISELEYLVSELEHEVFEYNMEIYSLISQMDSWMQEITYQQERAGLYYSIQDFLAHGQAGYSSENFRGSDSIFIISRTIGYDVLSITADYGTDITVYYSTSGTSASVEWSDHWDGYTTYAYIIPNHTGITIATFTNTFNSESFRVLIIVTD
jgi:TolA-binding protein